jgi:hypothetical protein
VSALALHEHALPYTHFLLRGHIGQDLPHSRRHKKKPVESSVVSFPLMQGDTFTDFVTNLTNYYRKTIEDLTAFLRALGYQAISTSRKETRLGAVPRANKMSSTCLVGDVSISTTTLMDRWVATLIDLGSFGLTSIDCPTNIMALPSSLSK